MSLYRRLSLCFLVMCLLLNSSFAIQIEQDMADSYIEEDISDSAIQGVEISTPKLLPGIDVSKKMIHLYENLLHYKNFSNPLSDKVTTSLRDYTVFELIGTHISDSKYELRLLGQGFTLKVTLDSDFSTKAPGTTPIRIVETTQQRPQTTTTPLRTQQITTSTKPQETTTQQKSQTSTKPQETTTQQKPQQTTTTTPVRIQETTTQQKPQQTTTTTPVRIQETTTQLKHQQTSTKPQETTTQQKSQTSTKPQETTTQQKPQTSTKSQETTTQQQKPQQTTTTPVRIQETTTQQKPQQTTPKPLESTQRLQITTTKPNETTVKPSVTTSAKPVQTTPNVQDYTQKLEERRFNQILGQWYLVGLPEETLYRKYNYRACNIITIYSHGKDYYYKSSHNIGNQTFTMHDTLMTNINRKDSLFTLQNRVYRFKLVIFEGNDYRLRLLHITNIADSMDQFLFAEKLPDNNLITRVISKHYQAEKMTALDYFCYRD